MDGNYAEVKDGIIFNVCVWDGVSVYNPGDDISLVLIPSD